MKGQRDRTKTITLGVSASQYMFVAILFLNLLGLLTVSVACGASNQKSGFKTIELSLLTDQLNYNSNLKTTELDAQDFSSQIADQDPRNQNLKPRVVPAAQGESIEEAEFRILGCASQYSATVRVSGMQTQMNLNDLDEQCTVYLRTFRWQGSLWTKRNGGVFAGPGEEEFVSDSSSSVVQVSNPSNLSPILKTQDKVSFSFRYVRLGRQGHVFARGARGEVRSRDDARSGPFLKWPEHDSAIELTEQHLRLRLECAGRIKMGEKVRDALCIKEQTSEQVQSQSIAELYFMIQQKGPSWKATLRSLIFSFLTHRPGEVVRIVKKEDIWHDSRTGRSGIVVNFPHQQRFGYNLESGCLKLIVLHKKRASRLGHWAFVWFDFDLGFEGAVCHQGPESSEGYDPDYASESELPSDSEPTAAAH